MFSNASAIHSWLRGKDSNLRPPGYEPGKLPTAPPRDVMRLILLWCRRPGSNRYGRNDHRILSPTCLPIPPRRQKLAPRVGLEPTTYRLTAGCSTIELSRRTKPRFFQRLDYYISDSYPSQGVRLIILSFSSDNNQFFTEARLLLFPPHSPRLSPACPAHGSVPPKRFCRGTSWL